MNSTNALDWSRRPPEIKKNIDKTFNFLAKQTGGHWRYNGCPCYTTCGVDEYEWLTAFIKNKYLERKEFIVMEIGAGDFSWGKGIAEHINKQTDLPEDIVVTIISLRGETNLEQEDVVDGKCRLLNLGAFKIEELFMAFKKRNIDVENQVDFIISSWTFRHLVDPMGTLAQTLHYLRPETGLLLMDGFYFLYENQTFETLAVEERNMIHLLLDLKAPFVMKELSFSRALNQFALKRNSSEPIHIPLEYFGLEYGCEHTQIYSEIVTKFKGNYTHNDRINMPENGPGLYGDRQLFDELAPYAYEYQPKYHSIQRREGLTQDSLHKAVCSENRELLLECLENDLDINHLSSTGFSPLQTSILSKNVEIFELLLKRNANISLANTYGFLPIHIAAATDKTGYFLRRLIKAKTPLNIKNNAGQTPLDLAIAEKNVKAVELLLNHDTFISEENEKSLLDTVFAEVYTAPEETRPFGLGEVINFLKRGDCVILHYGRRDKGYNSLMCDQEKKEGELQNLIEIEINPMFPLLSQDEWPSFLALAGFPFTDFDYNKIKDRSFNYELCSFGY